MFMSIGLKCEIDKCAAIHIKRGKHEQGDELPSSSGQQVPELGVDDYYKFLGKFENAIHLEQELQKLAGREYLR